LSERENASEGIRRFFTWIVGIALVIAAVIFLLPPARDPLEVRKATLASIVAIATHRRRSCQLEFPRFRRNACGDRGVVAEIGAHAAAEETAGLTMQAKAETGPLT
jgi:hypothetical protein